jgi:hypothetical protein
MTDEMKIAVDAVTKWAFFSWNYKTIHHEWINASGEPGLDELPEFLVKAKWTCNFDHMLSKWRNATRFGDSNSYLPIFFRYLDKENSRILVEWIMNNYNV